MNGKKKRQGKRWFLFKGNTVGLQTEAGEEQSKASLSAENRDMYK